MVRIVVWDALTGVKFAIQRGKSEFLEPGSFTDEELVFDLPVLPRHERSESQIGSC
jgi:hypothetical protein